ncbi:PKD domain-containing protein [Flavobacterium gelidilacus]
MVIQLITSNGSTLIGDPQTIPLTNLNSIFDINFDIPNDNGNGTYLFMPGTYGLNLSITLNLYGCTKTIILNNTVTHINFDVSPIALAGAIEVNTSCDIEDLNIISTDDGITNLNYIWEFSTNGGGSYAPISTAPGLPYLNNVASYFLSFPVTIRRKSNEFPLCSNPAYSNSIIIDNPVAPFIEFDLPENLCVGADPFILPLISSTQITGTWNTQQIDTSIPGLYTYTFTPDPNQCIVDTYTYELTIVENCDVFISWNADVGCQVSENDHDGLAEDVNIEDGDCIKVCENSIIVYTLTGITSLIDNTEWFVTGGTILSYSNTHCEIQWNAGAASYALQGTIYMSDSTINYINKCIEKVNAPLALIGILPTLEEEELTLCIKSPINFQNLSLNNGGNENLYYQWDFGDGTFSTEFEPIHLYNTPGNYIVTLTVTNGCSCIGTDEIYIKIVDEFIEITCPSVACEGQLSTYSINNDLLNNGCPVQWNVIGGQIVGLDSGVSSIEVIWDDVDDDGFGYVFVQSDECIECVSSVKIPVVKNNGDIVGQTNVCQRTQHLYSLPQWPTTEFNWTLNDNGTGATLITSNQRNEIFINSENPGTITLSCQYYNTLLNCGGNATVTINVKPELNILGSQTACATNVESYEITFDPTDPPINLSYTIDGPLGFSFTGSSILFDITYPEAGIYTFSIQSDNYCYLSNFEVKVNAVAPPIGDIAHPFPYVICAGTSIDFYASTITPDGTIHWSTNDGTILGSNIGNHITVVFDPQPSYYQITLWTEHEGCVSDPFVWELYNEPINTQILSTDVNVCGSSIGNYSTSETDSEIYIWSIQPPEAGSVVNGQNTDQVEILWNQEAMPANVRLTMRKCGNDYIANFPVNITPTPVLTITPINNPVCTGAPGASFSLTLDPATSYSSSTWDFGDNTGLITFPAGSPIIHVYNDPLLSSTVYNVTATVEGVDNCMFNATATTQITIAPSPIIAVTPNRNYSLCDGIFPGFMNYSITLQNGVFATSTVEWYYNGTLISDDTPTINASIPGSYYAVVTNLDGCTSTTQTYHTLDCPSNPGCVTPPLIVTNQTNTNCQQIEINITDPGAATGFTWGNLIGANANVVTATDSQYIATNIAPGLYQIPIYPTYDPSTGYCEIPFYREFIIPYSADLKFNVQCNSGSYTVNLLDYSEYYAQTPIQTFEFTTDGGVNWTTASSVATFSTTLAPGSYQLGIRIDRSDYPSCASDYIPLELPEFPNADFAIPTSVCLNTAMQFIAPTNTDPDLIYTWTFSDGSMNLQPNPFKTYTAPGFYQVVLTVANRFGCTSTFSKNVEVIGKSYDIGFLDIDYANTCAGDDLIISYDPGFGNTLPESYFWYHNKITDPPFAVSTNYDNDILVNQPGQYFVYVADANGCLTYTTAAISASFIPTPSQPLVTGTGTICKGSISSVKVPVDPSITYKWWVNGVPQTAWDNDNSVGMIHNTVGAYIYEVVAEIEAESGSFCSSSVATFTVHVIEKPDVPSIGFDFDSCSPYHVNVFITNPQAGIDYHWSNGDSGVSTEMIHDGPIRVTAKSSSCDVSAQIDLPLDLYMHTWYYPRGCYSFCELEGKEQNYIIGPLVEFNHWIWYQNNDYYTGGSGQVDPLTSLEHGTYQLYLETDYHCDITLADISINKKECMPCEIDFQISEVTPRSNNEGCFYEVSIYIGNPNGTTQVNLGSVGMDGYFVPSAFVVPNGGSFYTVNFYPLNGYTGGISFLSITATVDNETCYSEFKFELPPLCAGVDKQINTSGQSQFGKELKLVAAPNPTAGHTSVFFSFVETKGSKRIEVTDMYGRTLQLIKIDDNSGTVEFDCSSYEAGQYFILMKQENQILKNCKLIIK